MAGGSGVLPAFPDRAGKLGVVREDDVPGYLAPIRYFDYLTDKNPDTVAGVLRHNEIDVLSLITLYIHLSALLLSHEQQVDISEEERFKVGRWYEALGDTERAMQAYLLLPTAFICFATRLVSRWGAVTRGKRTGAGLCWYGRVSAIPGSLSRKMC